MKVRGKSGRKGGRVVRKRKGEAGVRSECKVRERERKSKDDARALACMCCARMLQRVAVGELRFCHGCLPGPSGPRKPFWMKETSLCRTGLFFFFFSFCEGGGPDRNLGIWVARGKGFGREAEFCEGYIYEK